MKFLVFFLFLLLGCKPSKVTIEETEEPSPITWDTCGYQVGDHLCNFTLVDQNGDTFDLYENFGKPIVIDFSTMWCGYCQVAAQEVDAVSDKYSNSDLVYITILIENYYGNSPTTEDCASWADMFGIIKSPVLSGERSLIDYPDGLTGVPVSGWPTFLFLNSDLTIDSMLTGYGSDSIDYKIQGILPEPAN